jgi:threonine dehydratase
MTAATGPTARGLVSEAEGTQPKLSNGGNHDGEQQQPRRRRTSTTLDGDAQDAGILLPDGRRVQRPSFPAQPDMYKRVPGAFALLTRGEHL